MSFFTSNFNLSLCDLNKQMIYIYTHTYANSRVHAHTHTLWWKYYLSIFQLNVLISLVAHGCLGKQQSQLREAESIHLKGCQREGDREQRSQHDCKLTAALFSLRVAEFRYHYIHFHPFFWFAFRFFPFVQPKMMWLFSITNASCWFQLRQWKANKACYQDLKPKQPAAVYHI